MTQTEESELLCSVCDSIRIRNEEKVKNALSKDMLIRYYDKIPQNVTVTKVMRTKSIRYDQHIFGWKYKAWVIYRLENILDAFDPYTVCMLGFYNQDPKKTTTHWVASQIIDFKL